MDYSALFTPLEAAKFKLKNRLVMAPMTTISGNPDGTFSEEEIVYLAQRAESGIGLIMTPACYCHKSGQAFERQVGCHDDSMLVSLSRCAEAINGHGAASFLQIHHGGNAAKTVYTGHAPWAPSAVKNRTGTSELPKAMTEDEIRMLVESFARAAGRARKAGFTGIELHGANTYLFQQFFSPYTNKRTDRWGSGVDEPPRHRFENRTRFAVEVVKAVRREVGADYPVSYRISPEEPDPDGYTTGDAIELLKLLVPHGIDLIHVSSWEYGKGVGPDLPEGSHPTLLIRQAIPRNIQVIGVGGVTYPSQAMRILNDEVELAAMGKILLLDKDWVIKVKEGREDTIRTGLHSEAERQALDIPDPMKEYTKRFFEVG